ncbi:MAG: hypothetical protein IJ368_10685 [Oscillospiraceae bacterium]|nr:hypothetical protein [Oscillospiraceae bacterium]
MTGFYSVSHPKGDFMQIKQLRDFVIEKITADTVIICDSSIHDMLLSSGITSHLLDSRSKEAAELIEKSSRYDNTAVIGSDVPRLIFKLDELYFFSDINAECAGDIIGQWDAFRLENSMTDIFVHSEYGSISCDSRSFRYICLKRTSSGNSVLYNELSRMAKEHKLMEQALSGARENVEGYIRDEPEKAADEGFVPSENMQYGIHSCRYCVEVPDRSEENKREWIAVEVEMKNANMLIGYYTMIFDSGNGIVIDDVFYSD